MANYTTLKEAIQSVVKTNGNNEITGALLQQALLAMINSLGSGYQFVGVATPTTNPGNPDAKVFYIANGKGVYINFGGLEVTESDGLVIFTYDNEWVKNNVAIPTKGGGTVEVLAETMITTTYSQLRNMRNSGTLVPGMQYRITDYACTTTQSKTQSAGHPFDIIVTADSKNTLNEIARAIQHEGDTYFADCDLSAWKIWYCLDNDTTKFGWADSANGKGVIYRMIDEWNNDVPYDFKNIQFARNLSVISNNSALTGTIYCYTFSVFLDGFSQDVIANDESVKAESDGAVLFGNNIITLRSTGVYSLNDIIFFTDRTKAEVQHYSNTFGRNCFSNTFGNGCFGNTFGSNCFNNTFGDNCHSNTFGNSCLYNTFGSNCYYNTFGNYCYINNFGNYCNLNNFGSNCFSNTFGDYCDKNIFGEDCNANTFGNYCSTNTFGNGCNSNTFGNYCLYNAFGNYCSTNTFGNRYNSNTFGNGCNNIVFASSSSATTKYDYYSYNHFGDGCQYILFKGEGKASSSAQVQNYKFAQGLQGTKNTYLTVDGVRSRAYETKVAKNSSGVLKMYCEADLIQ